MKTILLCCMMLMSMTSWALGTHETTTDHIEVDQLTLVPGGEYGVLSLILEGSRKYTTFGLDLYLPEGYVFDPYTSGDWTSAIDADPGNYEIYPYTSNRSGKAYSHTLSANIQSDGALRITTLSTTSAEFLSNSGTIVNVYVKATSYAKPGYGELKIKNCFFTTADGVQYDAVDETISDKLAASTSPGGDTGINDVHSTKSKQDAADLDIYNAAGQKVSASYRGMVIRNGKKLIKVS